MAKTFFEETVRLALCGKERCFYCQVRVLARDSVEGQQRPNEIATRDHTHPRVMGGTQWVIACAQCNQIKGSDPFEVFNAFMTRGGRAYHSHDRKRRYLEFRHQIILAGLHLFHCEAERLTALG